MPSTFRSLSPALITRETLAGVLTALALIPEVISFSVIAGVDPQVSLIASVVLCLAMSVLGGRPAMVTAAAGSVALVIGPMVHQHGVGYILPAVILAGIIQILFGICGMARLMRFIPPPVMTGFVNALGILIFFAQVPHFWSRQPLIVGLFVLTLLIVLWAPRFIKAVPAPLIAIVLLTAYTVTSGQLLPTVGDEGAMGGGLPGFNALAVPLDLNTLKIIWPCALSIAFVGLMESLLTAKLVDDLTHTPSNKSRESAGLGLANILAGCYGGIAGCAMIGQTIVNVEMGKARSRLSTIVAGLVLLLLVTVLSQVMAKIPMAVLAGVMVIVAMKTFSWQSIRPTALARNPWPETVVMAATVIVTVATSNLAIGVLAGLIAMALIPRRLRVKSQLTSETASPDQGK
ncbi:TPA: SulP family inorganic anion transporter [Klebsiella aerogenes]|jgi:SulP family sulfate permease|uniref:SulP family inorganic anion transporter n=1 Tax=Klebsiella aerogenes TaxID=548 RepID=UPI000751FAD2|nr:SulP family inorganic anion transporter [Klebsiella aerogenes]EKU0354321.1 SulP family inorganic anion transporter [Klebsiella aerogenes]ELA3179940.1 SulP family inorganic anion transporter [Klebsiella aerogenes]ELN9406301.1 SulP family inorganic anion transporter [Klebsiella aerogenes]ELX9633158.1 SulP family inorganic anion transporter [Klebsiella aerogenes]EMC2746465.1 SulP family inorganic anion transporter [Klebsiella aerogenes]